MSEKPVTIFVRSIATTDELRLQPIQPHQLAAILDPRISLHALLEQARAELEISGEPPKAGPH